MRVLSHEEEYADGTSAAPWPQLDGVRPKTSPSLVHDGRSEDGEGRGDAKYDSGAQPVGRSPAGGREEGLDRPRKDEDDGFLADRTLVRSRKSTVALLLHCCVCLSSVVCRRV